MEKKTFEAQSWESSIAGVGNSLVRRPLGKQICFMRSSISAI